MKIIDEVAGYLYGTAFRNELQFRNVYKYIEKYSKTTEKKELIKVLNDKVKFDKTIWICWFQGIDSAPKLVKRCYESVHNNKPEMFDVILVTYENIKDYINIPEFVMEKHKKGIINRTHLSDIIRTELLFTYGGCWIDATVYCSGKIPDYILSGELFTFRWSLMDTSTLSMSSWWIYACKGQKIISDVRDMIYCYWKNENILRNYFLFHIIFTKAVKNNTNNNEVFNKMPYLNNSMPHVLYWKMSSEFCVDDWNIIKSNSCVHKLSYKDKYLQGDIYNYYMALLEGKLV